jgi:hypothetical protein
MSNVTPLSDVQTLNFTILSLVRDAARSDLALACCRYGLSPGQLRSIGELTPADVLQIVASTGDVPLFAPREDIDFLLAAPRALVGALASARAPQSLQRSAARVV